MDLRGGGSTYLNKHLDNDMNMGSLSGRAVSLLGITLLSGAAALIYEITWIHWFKLLFGNTAYAASATFAAFFAGLAIGAALFGRTAGLIRRPLILYALIELALVPLVLMVPFIVHLYDPIYASIYECFSEHRIVFILVKFALAMGAMLPASILMGGTLPPLASAFVRRPQGLGREGGALYATNTLGAAIGCALSALWLPKVLGIKGTYAVGIFLSLIAAAAAFIISFKSKEKENPSSSKPVELITDSWKGANPVMAEGRVLWIAFASGFGVLALEVLMLHAMAQISDVSIYSVGAVLLVVLAALALGAVFVALTADRFSAEKLLMAALFGEMILLLTLPGLMVWITQGLSWYIPGTVIPSIKNAALLGGPSFLVAALVFPLTFRLASGGLVGPRLGGLLAANTLGGILGSLSASFLFLDGMGLWVSFAVLGLAYGSVSLMVPNVRGRLPVLVALILVSVAVFTTPLNPYQLVTFKSCGK